ncbi:MAG: hypothetical protein ACPGQ5_11580 [Alphaproteobacteria bacterium]
MLSRYIRRTVAGFLLLLASAGANAQENRTVDGDALGRSAWHPVPPAASELRAVAGTENFIILRNVLRDRVQESWRHRDNKPHGPIATIFYERLSDNFFASQMYDADFRSVFDAAFAARGVDLDDADVTVIDARTRAATVSYRATTCVFVLRVFGPIADNPISAAESNGDRNARIFVCAQNVTDQAPLRDTATAMLSILGAEGGRPDSLPALLEKLFESEKGA